MKSKEEKDQKKEINLLIKEQEIANRQAILNFVTKQADEKAKVDYDAKLVREKIEFQLINGRITSIYEEKLAQKRMLAEYPQDHEPKFAEFFPALGRLLSWTEEQQKAYRKPQIAPDTINELIYDRFPKDVREYIHAKNPYIKYCVREHKNYRFLGDDGILLLEQYIYDAIVLMRECTTYYEFRIKHSSKYNSSFQQQLFVL